MPNALNAVDSQTDTTAVNPNKKKTRVSFLLGYRKVSICALAILSITLLAFFDVPHLEKTIETIVLIAGIYCGVNVFKSGTSDKISTE